MSEPTLLMAFDSDDPEFTRGFECGQLWAALSLRPAEHFATLHSTNFEMARRCAKHYNYVLEAMSEDNTWISATFTPADAPDTVNLVSELES